MVVQKLPNQQQYLNLLFVIFVISSIFTIVTLVFCCIYWNMQAMSDSGRYVTTDWEYCIFYAENKLNLFASFVPALANFLPSGFAQSVANLGLQMILFLVISLATTYRAVRHPRWLPSSIALIIFAIIGALCFHAASPIVTFPTQMNPTLITLDYYIRGDMYDNVETLSGANCSKAYRFNLAFLVIQYFLFACLIMCLGVALYAEYERRVMLKNNPALQPDPVIFSIFPGISCGLAAIGYFFTLCAKVDACVLALKLFRTSDNIFLSQLGSFFPFTVGSVDITTIFFIITLMAVIRGVTVHSTSAFKLATATSALSLACLYSTVLGTFKLFDADKFWHNPYCSDFFSNGAAAFIFGYPDANQADHYCRDTRTSFVGQIIVFIALHLQFVTLLICFLKNQDRKSSNFERQSYN